MPLAIGIGIGASLEGVGVRTLDVAGAELVTNAQFTSDISGWTDASGAGGAISFSSGKLRAVDTTGSAAARQNVTTVAGERYALIAESAKTSTISGIATLGSTTPGSNDLLFKFVSAEKVALLEYLASTANAQIQIGAFSAGTVDWDYVSLRKLTATVFQTGKLFTDDFARSDGYMGITPDGLPWRFTDPLGVAELIPKIASGKVAMAQNAAGSSAGYPYLDLGNGKATGVHADVAFTGTGATLALISLKKSGSRLTIADILNASIHITFSDTSYGISIGNGGSLLSLQTGSYSVACATDGTNYPNVGWDLSGNTVTLRLPDQSLVTLTDSRLGALAGECAVFEHYYNTPATGTLTFDNASARLG